MSYDERKHSAGSGPRNRPLWEPGSLKRAVRRRSFWIVAAMVVSLACLHYLTPQMRFLPILTHPLGRHAVERIIFILPIATASFAFGETGGVITLIVAVITMLPRALFISPYPADALVETAAVTLVGSLVVCMIEVQEREKTLRQQAVLQLRTIHAVTGIVTGSLELDQILDGALGKVLEVTSADTGCIYLLERDSPGLALAVCRGAASGAGRPPVKDRPDREVPSGLWQPSVQPATAQPAGPALDEGLIEWVRRPGEPLLAPDLSRHPLLAALLPGFRSGMAVPLKSQGQGTGLIILASWQPDQFAPQDLQLLTAISNEIAVAVENARLHHTVARQLRIEQSLNQVAQEITSELEMDRVLPKVLRIARELVGADGGTIAMLRRGEEEIVYTHLDDVPAELKGVRIPREIGLAGQVVATRQPQLIGDYASWCQAVPAFVAAGVASAVGVPILSGDRLFGALVVHSLERSRRFSERDVAILEGLGRQAGIAVENANLYENMRYYLQQITQAQEDERRRIARELHDDALQSLIVLSRRIESLLAGDDGLSAVTRDGLNGMLEFVGELAKSIRRFSGDLRPPVLDDLGLVPALQALTSALTEQDGIQATLTVDGTRRRLSPEAELTLFRIAQEALNNVKKHAQATAVRTVVEFADDVVRISVQDDGRGYRYPGQTADLAQSGKLGLIGMHERARLLRGSLSIQSEPGRGTRVLVEVPG